MAPHHRVVAILCPMALSKAESNVHAAVVAPGTKTVPWNITIASR